MVLACTDVLVASASACDLCPWRELRALAGLRAWRCVRSGSAMRGVELTGGSRRSDAGAQLAARVIRRQGSGSLPSSPKLKRSGLSTEQLWPGTLWRPAVFFPARHAAAPAEAKSGSTDSIPTSKPVSPRGPGSPRSEEAASPDLASWRAKHEEKPIHKIVGKWVLGMLLGKGGFGRVYQGISAEDGSFVAIKQLQLNEATEGQAASLKREIELLRSLHHRNVVQYIDFVEQRKRGCASLSLVMEYVENGSLKDQIKRYGVFPEGLTFLYTYQILLAIDYVHVKVCQGPPPRRMLRCLTLGLPPGHHPRRREEQQHPHHQGGRGEADRLWRGAVCARQGRHAGRGHALLHGARDCGAQHARPLQRHLVAGLLRDRVAGRQPALLQSGRGQLAVPFAARSAPAAAVALLPRHAALSAADLRQGWGALCSGHVWAFVDARGRRTPWPGPLRTICCAWSRCASSTRSARRRPGPCSRRWPPYSARCSSTTRASWTTAAAAAAVAVAVARRLLRRARALHRRTPRPACPRCLQAALRPPPG